MAKCDETRIAEKRFYAIPPQALIADGLADGTITVDSTYCWKVGQIITCVSNTVTFRRLKIKAVLSENIIKVGDVNTPIYKFSDVSDLLVADTAMIELVDDAIHTGSHASNRRPVIDHLELFRAVYEEEPTIALRSHMVDWLGRSYCEDNPFPVNATVSVGDVNVQLTRKDNNPNSGDIHDAVRVGNQDLELDFKATCDTGKGEARVVDTLHCGGTNAVIIVGKTTPIEVKVGASAKADRKFVSVFAKDRGIHWGFKPNVDTSDGPNGGTPIFKNQMITFDVEASTSIYLIGTENNSKVAITEA